MSAASLRSPQGFHLNRTTEIDTQEYIQHHRRLVDTKNSQPAAARKRDTDHGSPLTLRRRSSSIMPFSTILPLKLGINLEDAPLCKLLAPLSPN